MKNRSDPVVPTESRILTLERVSGKAWPGHYPEVPSNSHLENKSTINNRSTLYINSPKNNKEHYAKQMVLPRKNFATRGV